VPSHWLKTTALSAGRSKDSCQDGKQLVRLAPVVGLSVEQVGAVAAHPHVLQGDHQPALVRSDRNPSRPPLGRDPRDDRAVLLVVFHLLFGHGHEVVLVESLGQLPEAPAFSSDGSEPAPGSVRSRRGSCSRWSGRSRPRAGVRPGSGTWGPAGSGPRTPRWNGVPPAGFPGAVPVKTMAYFESSFLMIWARRVFQFLIPLGLVQDDDLRPHLPMASASRCTTS